MVQLRRKLTVQEWFGGKGLRGKKSPEIFSEKNPERFGKMRKTSIFAIPKRKRGAAEALKTARFRSSVGRAIHF
jgi:hypothetical protein